MSVLEIHDLYNTFNGNTDGNAAATAIVFDAQLARTNELAWLAGKRAKKRAHSHCSIARPPARPTACSASVVSYPNNEST